MSEDGLMGSVDDIGEVELESKQTRSPCRVKGQQTSHIFYYLLFLYQLFIYPTARSPNSPSADCGSLRDGPQRAPSGSRGVIRRSDDQFAL